MTTEELTRNPAPARQGRKKQKQPVVQRPVHGVYLHVSKETATIMHTHEDIGRFFHIKLNPELPAKERFHAVLYEALSGCPFGNTVYIYSGPEIRDIIRNQGMTKECQRMQKIKDLKLRSGSVDYLSPLWQRLLQHASKEGLPNTSRMADYELSTYAITDARKRTYAAAILYGDNQIHIHEVKSAKLDMLEAELSAVDGVLSYLPAGKRVEMRHTDPDLQSFWNNPEPFFKSHPGTRRIAESVGKHIERGIRFEAPESYTPGLMSSATEWLVGRALGTWG